MVCLHLYGAYSRDIGQMICVLILTALRACVKQFAKTSEIFTSLSLLGVSGGGGRGEPGEVICLRPGSQISYGVKRRDKPEVGPVASSETEIPTDHSFEK